MPTTFTSSTPPVLVGWNQNSGTTSTGTTLNTATTIGTSGNAIAFHFWATSATTLTSFLVFQTAVNGTQANIQYTFAIYPADGSAATLGTLITSSTVTPNVGANKWVKCTFGSPPTLTAGKRYAVVVFNSSGTPGTDFPTVAHQSPCRLFDLSLTGSTFTVACRTATNGFSTAGTNQGYSAPFIANFGDGTLLGQPYTAAGTYANDQNERGWYIPSNDASWNLLGFHAGTNIASATAPRVRLYRGSTAPGGAYIAEFLQDGSLYSPLVGLIQAGSAHRVTFDFDANSTRPNYFEIQDSTAYAEILACRPLGGACSTVESGGAWVNTEERLPAMALLIGSLPTPSGGSASVDPLGGGLVV